MPVDSERAIKQAVAATLCGVVVALSDDPPVTEQETVRAFWPKGKNRFAHEVARQCVLALVASAETTLRGIEPYEDDAPVVDEAVSEMMLEMVDRVANIAYAEAVAAVESDESTTTTTGANGE